MSQILNSLVISKGPETQKALEGIMADTLKDFVLSITTYPVERLGDIDRSPDLIFVDADSCITPETAERIVMNFPKKTCVLLDKDPERRRHAFLKAGVDEVMSLAELQSTLGRHLLEKILTLKDLADAESRIEQSEERFRGIIENAHDIITLLDEEGTIVYTSPSFSRHLGFEPWEVLGQSLFDFVREEDRAILGHRFGRLLLSPPTEGVQMEFQFRRKDGGHVDLEAIGTNLVGNPTVQAVVLNCRDVTQQKQTEDELEKYRQHLETLVDQRTRELAEALATEKEVVEQQKTFVSMVSHEFRTPLTIIDGNAQIIQKRGQTLSQDVLQKRAGVIRTSVDRLVRLIETILSAHMIESGTLSIARAECNLRNVLKDAVADQQEISPTHVFRVDWAEDIPQSMQLDEKVIRQMFSNLLSNAVKYSPKNPDVLITGWREGGNVLIEVADRGIGIPENEMPKIFGKYFRASTSSGIPGSGLGLSLVKQFVELHQGSVGLDSKVGEGTAVTVMLPIVT